MMFNKISKRVNVSVVAILAILFVTLGSSVQVVASSIPENSSRLQVTGTAVVTAAPDTAHISLGVETRDASAEQAAQENAKRMAQIMMALKEMGLTDREISTSGYNIYSYNQTLNRGTEGETTVTTYQVQNRIEITTKNLDQVGKIVDAAVKAGANQVQGIRFDLADKQELQLKALANAVKQAHTKAETMAEAAGVVIGGLVTMNEDYGTYAPMYDTMVMRAQSVGNVETSITPGDVEVSARVTMVFWF